MNTLWILIIYFNGIAMLPMYSKEACLAAMRAMPQSTQCVDRATGEVIVKR